MRDTSKAITELILRAAEKARQETSAEPEAELTKKVNWPIDCTVGPGLEGAIACESKVGYVNGTKGGLIYRGYDIFDLCANSTFEEVVFLLLRGRLPNAHQLDTLKKKLVRSRFLASTPRQLMGFPLERMNPMAALRLGTNLMRQQQTFRDAEAARPDRATAISADEDSVPMELPHTGETRAAYEFRGHQAERKNLEARQRGLLDAEGIESCYHLISGVATITAAIARVRAGTMPIEPDPELSHAANFIYMMTGCRPTPVEERLMDIALILHADHGMNASTFACLVVASTLSDIYFSVGSGIAALNGPLHGGANEQVLLTLRSIGGREKVHTWLRKAMAKKQRIMGFGHRVYKAYDPRARILGPLAKHLAKGNKEVWPLYQTAETLEKKAVATLGAEKKVFPNVDFYSGLVYSCMGIPPDLFTPIFAVSRVAGWTARVLEYLRNNRIFRPRAVYVGPFDKKYVPIDRRNAPKESK